MNTQVTEAAGDHLAAMYCAGGHWPVAEYGPVCPSCDVQTIVERLEQEEDGEEYLRLINLGTDPQDVWRTFAGDHGYRDDIEDPRAVTPREELPYETAAFEALGRSLAATAYDEPPEMTAEREQAAAIGPEEEEEPEPELPDQLREAAETFVEATLAQAIHMEGGRDSDQPGIARFAAYHLADLEGADAGWLGRGFLIDDLLLLLSGDGEAER